MTKWLLGAAVLSASLLPLGACGNNDSGPCQIGSLGCFCYANRTCDDDLQCLPDLEVCQKPSDGSGGAPGFGEGGERGLDDGGSGSDGPPSGAPSTGGGGASGNQGGSAGSGGSVLAGSGGSSGSGGSGGSTANSFPDNPAGCAIVTTCPSCCETVGVYALDAFASDATLDYVTSFDVTAASATAEYDLATSDEIGAIFFRFASAQDIGSLGIVGSGTGGSLEVALVRAGGLDGCIYPIVGGSLSPVPDSCWGLGAGPYAALPADQIEVRVRSTLGGRAALSVTQVEYGP